MRKNKAIIRGLSLQHPAPVTARRHRRRAPRTSNASAKIQRKNLSLQITHAPALKLVLQAELITLINKAPIIIILHSSKQLPRIRRHSESTRCHSRLSISLRTASTNKPPSRIITWCTPPRPITATSLSVILAQPIAEISLFYSIQPFPSTTNNISSSNSRLGRLGAPMATVE